jgi:hypothetical protein
MSQKVNPMRDRWPGEEQPPSKPQQFTPGRTIPLRRPIH